MTIDRVNPGDWGIGDKYTSAQANAMDTNATYAADNRAGETDIIGALWTFTGIGRIIPSFVAGADANTSYQADGGNSVIRVTSAVTADRVYTLVDTNAEVGDAILIYVESSFANEITVRNNALATIYSLGNGERSDGAWAEFRYNGTDWVPWRRGGARTRVEAFDSTVPASWVADFDGWITPWGFGGGGGGGAGYTHLSSSTGIYNGGGGGGGSSILAAIPMQVIKGRSYSVACGEGGAGGDTGGEDGGDGGSSYILDDVTGAYVAVWNGAQGGQGGKGTTSSTVHRYAYGGAPVIGSQRGIISLDPTNVSPFLQRGPGCGGYGKTKNATQTGIYAGGRAAATMNPTNNPAFFATPGNGGADGADSGAYIGGGGGGGGAAGPNGNGGDGGAGSAATNAGTSAAGGDGVDGAANSGAGGGGAGASGHGSVAQGGTGTAGDGGTGYILLLRTR